MEFLKSFWQFLLISSPYLVLGLVLSGYLHLILNVEKAKKWFGKNKFSDMVWASLLGVPLPLCSCSVIPAAVTLRKAGASRAATSSFLISTPESGVDSIIMTYSLIDLPMTILRPVAAFVTAFCAGVMQLIFNPEEKLHFEAKTESKSNCCAHKAEKTKKENWIFSGLKYGFVDLSNDLAFTLFIGVLCGAVISYFVPTEFFIGLDPWLVRAGILAVSVPLYICAASSTPIAVSLMMKGLSPGAALLFLLAGPATNITNLIVLQKYLGKKAIVINVVAIVLVALIFSVFADYMYSNFWTISFRSIDQFGHDHQSGAVAAWWETASAVLMSVLIVRGIYVEKIKPRFSSKHNHDHHGHTHS
jgi:uncharacterized membrane protein YraQ (UPF0718 family)